MDKAARNIFALSPFGSRKPWGWGLGIVRALRPGPQKGFPEGHAHLFGLVLVGRPWAPGGPPLSTAHTLSLCLSLHRAPPILCLYLSVSISLSPLPLSDSVSISLCLSLSPCLSLILSLSLYLYLCLSVPSSAGCFLAVNGASLPPPPCLWQQRLCSSHSCSPVEPRKCEFSLTALAGFLTFGHSSLQRGAVPTRHLCRCRCLPFKGSRGDEPASLASGRETEARGGWGFPGS